MNKYSSSKSWFVVTNIVHTKKHKLLLYMMMHATVHTDDILQSAVHMHIQFNMMHINFYSILYMHIKVCMIIGYLLFTCIYVQYAQTNKINNKLFRPNNNISRFEKLFVLLKFHKE